MTTAIPADGIAEALPPRRWRWLRKNPTLVLGAVLLLAIALLSLAAPWVATHDPTDIDPLARMQGVQEIDTVAGFAAPNVDRCRREHRRSVGRGTGGHVDRDGRSDTPRVDSIGAVGHLDLHRGRSCPSRGQRELGW
mgnify:CR=1 FL=1